MPESKGKPSKGTPADRRLSENRTKPAKAPFPGAKPPFKPKKG